MATSSRQSALFGIQDWKRFYQTYREADFQSYDYETLRKSFIDYLTQYYPETFNDYIESSEYVALLDVIAFMGQSLAFRNDLNARENFIDTAERRDSVVKLANLVSYTPKRNITGQGLLKLTAVSTTENVIDINGVNLSNTVVLWNDSANKNWQEQFNMILNASLINSQRIGRPGNSNLINGIKSDEYTININPDENPILPFKSQIDGTVMNFELVSVSSINSESYYELPPAPNGQFIMLYRNDKLGYGSSDTGFFFYFKQGTLLSRDFGFSERIENNSHSIDIMGINDTDTWLYELDDAETPLYRWRKVDSLYAYTDSVNNTISRKIFAVTSRYNDQVNYVFGDGTFGEIPVGKFRAYVRSGNAATYTINPSEMQGIVVNLDYISRNNKTETLTLTLNLQTTVNTALERESLLSIKERAPARYYTQNRMVNGEDYSNFPFTQYNSIAKSKALNRSSIGISRNLDLLDPTAKYSSVNVFADDGALYTDSMDSVSTFSTSSINIALEFVNSTLSVLLSDSAAQQYYQANYTRYVPSIDSSGSKIYWNKSSVSNNAVTGYFYNKIGNSIVPISAGISASNNIRYATKGAHLKFVAPAGKYFTSDNRLMDINSSNRSESKSYIWVGIIDVIGDGKNFGNGNFLDNSGPIKLSSYVPTGAELSVIIPAFDNTVGSTIINQMTELIKQEQNFSLIFDNSVPINLLRWSVTTKANNNWFVKFEYNSINSNYEVRTRNINYYFGSVYNVRFSFENNKKIYDQKTGQTLSDFVNIIKTNDNATSTRTLGMDYVLNVTDQVTLSDGYPDDYQVKVSSINSTTGFSYDPDFFSNISDTQNSLVFFKKYLDSDALYRSQLLSTDAVIYNYSTKNDILEIMYDYPANTVFYATSEKIFWQTQPIKNVTPTVYNLVEVTDNYFARSGRGNINFQYRHNSDNSTRVDVATTNIIDLYLVTQSYYTQYQNWLNDTTGTVTEPVKPSTNELQQAYGNLDKYKMLSDTIILNSVIFKPLFGKKAAPALRGQIKVIKSSNITVSDSQIRSSVLSALNNYFTLDKWDFGDTFYFSELSAYLHFQLGGLISSVVLVPNDPTQTFGDLYEIRSAPNEIFVNGATTSDIIVISSLTAQTLQQS